MIDKQVFKKFTNPIISGEDKPPIQRFMEGVDINEMVPKSIPPERDLVSLFHNISYHMAIEIEGARANLAEVIKRIG